MGFILNDRGGDMMFVDRIDGVDSKEVKRVFKELSSEGNAKLLTKKPIIAGEEELKINPRAKQSKLF